jgi:hypothetical protein
MESPLRKHLEETFFTLLIWIGLWGIASHLVSIYCKSQAHEILLYTFLVGFGYFALYTRNHI